MAFFLPEGYRENIDPVYGHDPSYANDDGPVWQPEVYELAGRIAEDRGLVRIIDVGCGKADKALALPLLVLGIDHGPNLPSPARGWIEDGRAEFYDADLEQPLKARRLIPLLARSVVVCADVIEHLKDPTHLLEALAMFSTLAGAVLISTPDRDLVRGPDDLGPPANAAHVREWNEEEFAALLGSFGIQAEVTHTVDNSLDRRPFTLLAVALRGVQDELPAD